MLLKRAFAHRALRVVGLFVCLLVCMSGCARMGRGFNQVLVDFRLRPAPEEEKPDVAQDIMAKLDHITTTELERLNADPANVEIKFEEIPDNPLGLGHFRKVVKVYEKAYPLEVTRRRVPRVQQSDSIRKRGYRARVEYRYRMFRGEEFPSRDDARDSEAEQATDDTGREIYRYYFDHNGVWNARPGKLDRVIESKVRQSNVPEATREEAETDFSLKRIEIGGSLRVRAEYVKPF